MEQNSFDKIPDNFLKKWQEIADLLADIMNVPAALVMKTDNEFMEVFVSSKTENNPYTVGDKEHWHGLYCETVIKTQKQLLIPNALKDKDWDKNPDLELGMLAYLGLPINFPDKRPFGTLCVLNNKEHTFSGENEKILQQFKNVIELDLALIQSLDLKDADNASITKRLFNQNEEYLTVNEELKQSNDRLYQEQQRLSESENELNRFFDLVPDMVCIASANGYFKRLNSMWEKVLGFTIEELKSKPFAEFIHPDDIEATSKEVEKQLNKQSVVNFINRYRCKSGEYKWLDWVAIPSPDGENLYSAARDITEKRQIENELIKAKEKTEESEKNLRFLFENMVQGVVYHKPNGDIIRANQAAADILGLSLDQLYGKTSVDPHWKTIHEDGTAYPGETHPAMISIKTQKPVRDSIMGVFIPEKNAYSWININSIPQFNDKNELIQIVVTFEDITETKLKESKITGLSKIIENSLNEIYIFDKKSLKFLFANKGALRNIGYSADELKALSPTDLKPDYTLQEFHTLISPLINQESEIIRTESIHKRKNGSTYEVETNLQLAEYNNAEVFVAFVSDISERKSVENEVNRQKKLFETMFNTIQEGVVITNTKREILLANKGMFSTFGYQPAELIGKETKIFYADVDKFENAGNQVFNKEATPDKKNYRTYYKSKSGKRFPGETFGAKLYDNQDNWIGNIGIMRDITERKKFIDDLRAAKEKAEESEKKYKALYNNAPLSYQSLDKDGNFIDINPMWTKTLGYERDEVIGKWYGDFLHPDNVDHFKKNFPAFKKRGYVSNVQFKLRKKDGTFIYVSFEGCAAYTPEGEFKQTYCVFKDITEEKALENALIAAKEKAEENSRLKTAFLNNLSHEIRTPLNAICGFSAMLDNPNINKEKRENFVSVIHHSSDQLLAVVSDTLTMSSLEKNQESADTEAVNLNEILDELLSIFKQQTGNKNISLYSKQALNDQQSVVYTDKTKLTQILSNLIANALKFTPEGFIEFGYTIKTDIKPVEIQFYVKDSGIGIRPEKHEKIFEHFVQADKTVQQNYGGTGLGLSISKGFAELLGGKIWVVSEPEKGSTFYFTIPYEPANKPHDKKPKIELKNNSENTTILIAEDEEYNFMYLEELLSSFNYTLIHAKDGQETVELFKANGEISLILMDIKMPVMDGHTAAKLIKEQKPDLPIIAQSAYALEHERTKYEEIFDDYLAKPISEEDLIGKISKYLN